MVNPSSACRKAACARWLQAISFKLERRINRSLFKLRLNPSRRLEGGSAPAHTLPLQLRHLPSPAPAEMKFLKVFPLLSAFAELQLESGSFLRALSFQVRKPFCKLVDVLGAGQWPRNPSVPGGAGQRAAHLPAAKSFWRRSRLQRQGGRRTTGIPSVSLGQEKMRHPVLITRRHPAEHLTEGTAKCHADIGGLTASHVKSKQDSWAAPDAPEGQNPDDKPFCSSQSQP